MDSIRRILFVHGKIRDSRVLHSHNIEKVFVSFHASAQNRSALFDEASTFSRSQNLGDEK
jgi:hypothetical protein